MQRIYVGKHISSGTTGTPVTTPLIAHSCYVTSVVYNATNAGSAWSLTIQDRSAPPKVLTVMNPVVVPTNGQPIALVQMFHDQIQMRGGVDAVTTGTTAGALDVWVNGSKSDDMP